MRDVPEPSFSAQIGCKNQISIKNGRCVIECNFTRRMEVMFQLRLSFLQAPVKFVEVQQNFRHSIKRLVTASLHRSRSSKYWKQWKSPITFFPLRYPGVWPRLLSRWNLIGSLNKKRCLALIVVRFIWNPEKDTLTVGILNLINLKNTFVHLGLKNIQTNKVSGDEKYFLSIQWFLRIILTYLFGNLKSASTKNERLVYWCT